MLEIEINMLENRWRGIWFRKGDCVGCFVRHQTISLLRSLCL